MEKHRRVCALHNRFNSVELPFRVLRHIQPVAGMDSRVVRESAKIQENGPAYILRLRISSRTRASRAFSMAKGKGRADRIQCD